MGLMASFERGMERFLVPVAIKLNSQKHVAAVRDGFVFTFPIIMASSLIILINFAILSPDGFIAGLLHLNSIFPNLEKAQAIFTPVMNGSVNIMSIMIAFLVARNMAISYEQDDLLCGLTAIFEGSGQSLLRLEAISFCQIEYRLVTFLQLLRDFRHLTAADVLA